MFQEVLSFLDTLIPALHLLLKYLMDSVITKREISGIWIVTIIYTSPDDSNAL